MKKYVILLYLVFGSLAVSAQKVILVQDGTSATLYETIEEAVTNAPAGAYVYLPGGHFDVPSGGLVIDKELHIIGAGHYPDSTVATGVTRIEGGIYLISGADNGSLEGFYISGSIVVGKNSTSETNVSNFIIKRLSCNSLDFNFSGSSGSLASSFLINGCYIRGSIYGNYAKNIIFFNNLIEQGITSFDGSDNELLFENNIFFWTSRLLENVSDVTFRNNIFRRYSTSSSSNNEFYNNIFEKNSLSSALNEKDNIYGTDFSSLFINHSGLVFNYSHDYHLASNSPAKGAGFNGTDIGIYGGGSPYKEGAVPSNPHIQFVDIANQTDLNGKLKIHIKVQAQDN